MSEIIGDTACESCQANGGDKSGNHLMLFDDGGSYCNRCGYGESKGTFTEPKVGFNSDKTPEELVEEIEDVRNYTCYRDVPERGLATVSLRHYGIRVTVSTENGKGITGTFFPATRGGALTGYNIRYPNKGFGKRGDVKGSDFFGAEVCPPRGNKLFITEGAYDMVALHQCMYKYSKPEWRKNLAVVSIHNGSSSVTKEFERNKELIRGYKEVVLVFDQDSAGRKAEEKAIKVLGRDKVRLARFSEKDPNDMIMKGKYKELYQSVLSADKPRPDSIVTVDDVWDKAFIKPEMGLSFPWPSLTELTCGIRRGLVYLVGAAPKIGKTDFEYQLIAHMIQEHGEHPCLYDFESNPVKTVKRLAGKCQKQVFHDPRVEYKDEDLKEGMVSLREHLDMYDHGGSRDWEVIKEVIRYQAASGKWLFIIDPLTALISQFSSSEANDVLNSLMTDIASMCVELNITFFLFSHVNPPRTGKAHDDGGRVLSSQFTGSRAMEKWGHYGIGIERNRNAEEEEDRNNSTHRLLFDREFGEGGSYQCTFHKGTGQYLEEKLEVNF